MRVRLAAHQPRSLQRDEPVCDHHYGLALESDPQARVCELPPCRTPRRFVIFDFVPGTVVVCEEGIEHLRQPE